MNIKIYHIANLFILATFGFCLAQGVTGREKLVPPDYATFEPPQTVGDHYIDPVFNTRVTRITNSHEFGNDVLGGYFNNSEVSVFNKDGSLFITTEAIWIDGERKLAAYLYNGRTGERLKSLGTNNMQPWWIRWALAGHYTQNGQKISFDPNTHFYKYHGNEIRLYDVQTMNYTVLRKFSEYTAIGPAGGEGDLSDDGRYWVLDGDAKEIFVYDLIDDIKYPVSTFNLGTLGANGSAEGLDYAAISPSGKYVVVCWSTKPSLQRGHGIEVYDKEWNFQRQVYPDIIHWELGIDSFGHEVIYTVAGFAFPEFFSSYGVNPGDVISIRLSDGYIRLLLRMDPWAPQVMSACHSVTGGDNVFVSFYPRVENPLLDGWAPFWGEIVQIPSDGSQNVNRLVHHRSRRIEGKIEKYWQPDAVVNRQGDRILFRSTFIYDIADVYMLELNDQSSEIDDIPPNEPSSLKAETMGPTRVRLVWTKPDPASDGDGAIFYRIYRDGVLIGDVQDTVFIDSLLVPDHSYFYQVFSVDKSRLVSERAVQLSFRTAEDDEPPSLMTLQILSNTALLLGYSEPVEVSSAENASNYISSGFQVLDLACSKDGMYVTIQTSELQKGSNYSLLLDNIYDRTTKLNPIAMTDPVEFTIISPFSDDFNQPLDTRWQPMHPSRWKIENTSNPRLLLEMPQDVAQEGKRLAEIILVADSQFSSPDFTFSCQAQSLEDLALDPYADYAIVYGYLDSLNYTYIQYHTYDIVISEIKNGERVVEEKISAQNEIEHPNQIKIQLDKDQLHIYFAEHLIYSTERVGSTYGKIGLGSFNDRVAFDNIELVCSLHKDQIPPKPPSGMIVKPLP
ncbi:hypothetical protein GF406_16525 [candidate division KSB1 bacterium]|nr:hypothetical protein [candidate division KSB1 bacterium]